MQCKWTSGFLVFNFLTDFSSEIGIQLFIQICFMFWHIFDLNFDCVLGEGLPHKMHFNVEENKSLSSFFHKKNILRKRKPCKDYCPFTLNTYLNFKAMPKNGPFHPISEKRLALIDLCEGSLNGFVAMAFASSWQMWINQKVSNIRTKRWRQHESPLKCKPKSKYCSQKSCNTYVFLMCID